MNKSDMELLHLIQGDDEFAFESIFKKYYGTLCYFSYNHVKNNMIAEEIVQEVFCYLWDKRRSLDISVSVKSYLFKAVHNNSLKYLQHQKIVFQYSMLSNINMADNFDFQEDYLEMDEIYDIIQQTLNSVSSRTREIFDLNRNEGLKYKEIAECLNISLKTVESHITQILKILRVNLKDYLPIAVFIFLFLTRQ